MDVIKKLFSFFGSNTNDAVYHGLKRMTQLEYGKDWEYHFNRLMQEGEKP